MTYEAVPMALGLSLVLSACGGNSQSDTGYILLNESARSAGVSVLVPDRGATAAVLVEVAGNTQLSIVGASQPPANLSVHPGELVYVENGETPARRLQIGQDVASDQLRVVGAKAGGEQLARDLGGRIEEDEAGLRILLPGIFAAVATASLPDGVVGLTPVALAHDSGPAWTAAAHAEARPLALGLGSAPTIGALAGGTSAGSYTLEQVAAEPPPATSEGATATTSASASGDDEPSDRPPPPVHFRPARGCRGVTGTWRGRVYSELHEAYYDFTLLIRQVAADHPHLVGTVVARSWVASAEQVEPPKTCIGDQHFIVAERAAGVIEPSGDARFDSTSWRVASTVCGEKLDGYSLDKFRIPKANEASSSAATVWDDAVWPAGLPIELTRVSCK